MIKALTNYEFLENKVDKALKIISQLDENERKFVRKEIKKMEMV